MVLQCSQKSHKNSSGTRPYAPKAPFPTPSALNPLARTLKGIFFRLLSMGSCKGSFQGFLKVPKVPIIEFLAFGEHFWYLGEFLSIRCLTVRVLI